MTEKTPEQLAAEAAAKKAQEAADKAKAKAEAAAKKKAEAEEAKAKREAERKAKADAKAASKQAKADERAAKKQEKEAAEAAKAAKKQPEQNGVRRPAAGTITGSVWDTADAMSKTLGGPVAVADLVNAMSATPTPVATIRTQYAQWRKFHGVAGRVLSTVDIAKAKATEEARKAAEAKAAEEAKAKEKATA